MSRLVTRSVVREHNFSDLIFFIAVARERSFTRAAAQLGMSQSTLSHSLRALETRLGVGLLTRTTRSVAPTEAGLRLLRTVPSYFDDIDAELLAVSELRDKPAGRVRVASNAYATRTILLPRLANFMRDYPDIKIDIDNDEGMADIVAAGYDLGVKLGAQIDQDMIAARIGPDLRMVIVGAPAYLAQRPKPSRPKDLMHHNCINQRMPIQNAFHTWKLSRKDGQETQVRVEGQLSFTSTFDVLDAALAGHGLAYVPSDLAEPHITAGRLHYVLEGWHPPVSGLHLYYASRQQSSRAMNLVIDALRTRL